jgi:hypothetical protein
VATLYVSTKSFGDIRIHDAYNWNAEINLKLLAEHFMGDSDLLLGGFNLAGPPWTGDNQKTSPKGEQLTELIHRRGMICLNEPGQITYFRSIDTTTCSSVIDL